MAEVERQIVRGIGEGQLAPIAGGDGTSEAFVSKAAVRRLLEKGREARRIEVALDVAANGHGYGRAVRGSRRGR